MSKYTLTEYTLFSAIFLQTQSVKAEVQYFDIEPDIVLSGNGDLFLLDLDEDGTTDLRFNHNEGVYFTDWGYEPRFFDAIFAGAVEEGIWIAGSYFTVGSAAYSSFITYRPYLIPLAYPIGVLLSFQDDYSQLVAATISTSLGEIYRNEGNWSEGEEGFIGLRREQGSHYYYGWLRLTVSDSSKSVTIHDYALETIADKSIIAGDSVGTLSVTSISLEKANIYWDGIMLFIHPGSSAYLEKSVLNIYDLTGKLVFSKLLSGGDQSLTLPLQTGIYIATYANGDNTVSKVISMI